MKRALPLLLSLALASGLLYFLFQRFDTAQIWADILKLAQNGQISILIFWSFIYVLLQGLRFFVLYPSRASLARHIGLNFCNHTANILLPGRAGEATRPAYLKLWWPDLSLKRILKWTLLEKVYEFISMLLFIGTGLLLFYGPWSKDFDTQWFHSSLSWAGPLLVISVVGAQFAYLAKRKIHLSAKHDDGENSDEGRLKPAEKAFWATTLSYVTWVTNSLGVLAITQDAQVAFALIVSMTLASAIPMLPAGLGAAQWAAVALADLVSIAESEALAFSSAIHVIWILTRLSIGLPLLFFVWGWPKKIEDLPPKKEPAAAKS